MISQLTSKNQIQNKIYTLRGVQVMLDRDLAVLYGVETRALNQAVKRNIERFPKEFMFQLTKQELENWMSQIVISNKEMMGIRKIPYVFTEQGVAMLSAVLKSTIAIKISLQIMCAFVQMRNILSENSLLENRMGVIEQKQLKTDTKLDKILDALSANQKPKQGIFYDGQIFDAYIFACDLIKQAKNKIILIDNYIDETTLLLLTKRNPKIKATIYTKSITKKLKLDFEKHNKQYQKIILKEFDKSHDRFLIIDNDIYHLGASLKDLGKKWFGFSKIKDIDLLGKLPK